MFFRIWYHQSMKAKNISAEKLNDLSREEIAEAYLELQKETSDQQEEIARLKEELNHAKAMLFGRKSERRDEALDGQISFGFNEVEAAAQEAEPEKITVREHIRKVRKPGKKAEDLSKLPKEIRRHRIPEERLNEIFPGGWKMLPDEVYTNVEYVPAKYIAVEHHIEVYSAKKEDRIVRADHPTELLSGSIATPSLVAGIMNGKYVNGMPLYRMEQEFERSNVPISRQNMAGWVIKTTERYLSLMYDRLKEELMTHAVIHADETPLLVSKDGRKAGSKSYMWVYRSNALGQDPVIIYEYRMTRKTDHPKEFLKDFRGTLVTDGYEAYHKLARDRSGEIRVAGCWVHLKRKYSDAIKSMGKAGADTAAGTLAEQAVKRIQDIFRKDNEWNTLDAEERLRKRKEELQPLVDAFFEWVKEHRADVTRKSATGRAFSYSLEQEPYLREFLNDGMVPMDNNAAERAIRPFCIGKKNWVMCDTIHGAEDSAVVYSLTETAKANGLRPYEYLKHLLTQITRHMEDRDTSFLNGLLPWSETLPSECRNQDS